MKRLIPALLCVILLLAPLASCKKNDNARESTRRPRDTTTTAHTDDVTTTPPDIDVTTTDDEPPVTTDTPKPKPTMLTARDDLELSDIERAAYEAGCNIDVGWGYQTVAGVEAPLDGFEAYYHDPRLTSNLCVLEYMTYNQAETYAAYMLEAFDTVRMFVCGRFTLEVYAMAESDVSDITRMLTDALFVNSFHEENGGEHGGSAALREPDGRVPKLSNAEVLDLMDWTEAFLLMPPTEGELSDCEEVNQLLLNYASSLGAGDTYFAEFVQSVWFMLDYELQYEFSRTISHMWLKGDDMKRWESLNLVAYEAEQTVGDTTCLIEIGSDAIWDEGVYQWMMSESVSNDYLYPSIMAEEPVPDYVPYDEDAVYYICEDEDVYGTVCKVFAVAGEDYEVYMWFSTETGRLLAQVALYESHAVFVYILEEQCFDGDDFLFLPPYNVVIFE